MYARILGARGRVVQNGIGEAHLFLLTHVRRGRSLMGRSIVYNGGGQMLTVDWEG